MLFALGVSVRVNVFHKHMFVCVHTVMDRWSKNIPSLILCVVAKVMDRGNCMSPCNCTNGKVIRMLFWQIFTLVVMINAPSNRHKLDRHATLYIIHLCEFGQQTASVLWPWNISCEQIPVGLSVIQVDVFTPPSSPCVHSTPPLHPPPAKHQGCPVQTVTVPRLCSCVTTPGWPDLLPTMVSPPVTITIFIFTIVVVNDNNIAITLCNSSIFRMRILLLPSGTSGAKIRALEFKGESVFIQ